MQEVIQVRLRPFLGFRSSHKVTVPSRSQWWVEELRPTHLSTPWHVLPPLRCGTVALYTMGTVYVVGNGQCSHCLERSFVIVAYALITQRAKTRLNWCMTHCLLPPPQLFIDHIHSDIRRCILAELVDWRVMSAVMTWRSHAMICATQTIHYHVT